MCIRDRRYAVNVKPKSVEWASQNMLVLGIVVIAGLALHFANFWYKMQFAEIIGVHDLGAFGPTDGAAYIKETFGNPVFTVLYLIWLAALWFHLTHGFWSALQTLGWSNKIWFERWKTIGNIYSTLDVYKRQGYRACLYAHRTVWRRVLFVCQWATYHSGGYTSKCF